MENIKFKTSIKCTGCLDKITPLLIDTEGIEHWEIDLKNSDNIFTVNPAGASDKHVIKEVKNAGF